MHAHVWFDSPVVRRSRAVGFAINQCKALEHRAIKPNVPEHSNQGVGHCVQCATAKQVFQDTGTSPVVANLQHAGGR